MSDRATQVSATKEAAIYNGCTFSVQEIEIALRVLQAEIKTLRESFDKQSPASVKLAAESTAKVANQIATLSAVLARTFASHLNRHTRVVS